MPAGKDIAASCRVLPRLCHQTPVPHLRGRDSAAVGVEAYRVVDRTGGVLAFAACAFTIPALAAVVAATDWNADVSRGGGGTVAGRCGKPD